MKKEDYEKQIQELNEQALKLEKTMHTYRNLEKAKRDGHQLVALIDSSEFGEVNMIEIVCQTTGANYL
jgi:spermidine synthase